MRPRKMKKHEHKAQCTIVDVERAAFVVLVGFTSYLVPLELESRAASYVRIKLRQPTTEQRLRRLLPSVFRVPTVHFPDL